MTLPYLFKLLCLCMASFFLLHLALALLVGCLTPASLRLSARIRPVVAARLLFSLRMLPTGLSVLIVAGLCAPSYLWLEPRTATSEEVGLLCLGFSILAVAIWTISFLRCLRAVTSSVRYLRSCRRFGQKTELPGEPWPVWMVEEPGALFAIGGIIRPRLLISRRVMSVLSSDQLAAALRHERAHWMSRDNLKRLLLMLAPDLVWFLSGFATLERAWAKYAERAADDRAGDDPAQSLALATALVRVSRIGITGTSLLAAPLLADDGDLSGRVERLLNAALRAEAPELWVGWLIRGAAVMVCAAVVTIGLQPALLQPVHRFLENLIR